VHVRGTVYHHRQLVFHNGGIGKKYLILLNTPTEDEPFLFVKTTSQKKNKPEKAGCLENWQLFFIPVGTTESKKPTWVQIYEIYPFERDSVINEKDIEIVGSLDEELLAKIVDCLLASKDDILPEYRKLLKPPILDSIQKLADKFRKKH